MQTQIEIDLKDSKLVIDGSKADQDKWKAKVLKRVSLLASDQGDRIRIYNKRRDFYNSEQANYTNVIGKTQKEKRGHTNGVYNYIGRTVEKIYYGVSNTPPKLKALPLYAAKDDGNNDDIRAQAVENFVDKVFSDNRFWKSGFKRSVFNQILAGNFGVKVYPDLDGEEIKISIKDKMENLLVGWSGDDMKSFDFVIDKELRTITSVEDEFGIEIKVPDAQNVDSEPTNGDHEDPYGLSQGNSGGQANQRSGSGMIATGKNDLPTVQVVDYADDKRSCIIVGDKVVQFCDPGFDFNPWSIGGNIPVPNTNWDRSDIDLLIDPQVEFNETNNDVRDFIRTAVNTKYVVVNMPDFDPESVKTGSGQIIFVEGEGADFRALQQNVNTFPADTYLQRIKKTIHDLGVPEVTFGSSQSDSGKSKAVDFQSFVDVVEDKRIAWELVLDEVIEKIQILGYKMFKDEGGEMFCNPETGEFQAREFTYDWVDIVPLTQPEKVVNVMNKYNAGLQSLRTSLEELGTKDVEEEIARLKTEWKDPDLAAIRGKATQLMPGILKAQERANEFNMQSQMEMQQEMQANGQMPPQDPNAPAPASQNPSQTTNPTLISSQNQGNSLPASQPGMAPFSPPQAMGSMTNR